MTILSKIIAAQEMALCLVRKWWRPAGCVTLVVTLLINGVVIPMRSGTVADMTQMAAYAAALTAAFGVRAFEKMNGAE
jgi:hypothetical protein